MGSIKAHFPDHPAYDVASRLEVPRMPNSAVLLAALAGLKHEFRTIPEQNYTIGNVGNLLVPTGAQFQTNLGKRAFARVAAADVVGHLDTMNADGGRGQTRCDDRAG